VIKISAAELQRDIDPYQDLALTQAVAVTRNGREQTVLISIDEYHPPPPQPRERLVLGLDDFTAEDLAALEKTVRLRHPGHSTRRSSGSCLAFPTPVPGLVVRYSYLWASEHARGREEGAKDRPCAVVLVVIDDAGEPAVVLPITINGPRAANLVSKFLTQRSDASDWTMRVPGSCSRKPTGSSGQGQNCVPPSRAMRAASPMICFPVPCSRRFGCGSFKQYGVA
jgi:hypothetical protein